MKWRRIGTDARGLHLLVKCQI